MISKEQLNRTLDQLAAVFAGPAQSEGASASASLPAATPAPAQAPDTTTQGDASRKPVLEDITKHPNYRNLNYDLQIQTFLDANKNSKQAPYANKVKTAETTTVGQVSWEDLPFVVRPFEEKEGYFVLSFLFYKFSPTGGPSEFELDIMNVIFRITETGVVVVCDFDAEENTCTDTAISYTSVQKMFEKESTPENIQKQQDIEHPVVTVSTLMDVGMALPEYRTNIAATLRLQSRPQPSRAGSEVKVGGEKKRTQEELARSAAERKQREEEEKARQEEREYELKIERENALLGELDQTTIGLACHQHKYFGVEMPEAAIDRFMAFVADGIAPYIRSFKGSWNTDPIDPAMKWRAYPHILVLGKHPNWLTLHYFSFNYEIPVGSVSESGELTPDVRAQGKVSLLLKTLNLKIIGENTIAVCEIEGRNVKILSKYDLTGLKLVNDKASEDEMLQIKLFNEELLKNKLLNIEAPAEEGELITTSDGKIKFFTYKVPFANLIRDEKSISEYIEKHQAEVNAIFAKLRQKKLGESKELAAAVSKIMNHTYYRDISNLDIDIFLRTAGNRPYVYDMECLKGVDISNPEALKKLDWKYLPYVFRKDPEYPGYFRIVILFYRLPSEDEKLLEESKLKNELLCNEVIFKPAIGPTGIVFQVFTEPKDPKNKKLNPSKTYMTMDELVAGLFASHRKASVSVRQFDFYDLFQSKKSLLERSNAVALSEAARAKGKSGAAAGTPAGAPERKGKDEKGKAESATRGREQELERLRRENERRQQGSQGQKSREDRDLEIAMRLSLGLPPEEEPSASGAGRPGSRFGLVEGIPGIAGLDALSSGAAIHPFGTPAAAAGLTVVGADEDVDPELDDPELAEAIALSKAGTPAAPVSGKEVKDGRETKEQEKNQETKRNKEGKRSADIPVETVAGSVSSPLYNAGFAPGFAATMAASASASARAQSISATASGTPAVAPVAASGTPLAVPGAASAVPAVPSAAAVAADKERADSRARAT